MLYDPIYMWNLRKLNSQKEQTGGSHGQGEVGEMGEGVQRVQISSYEMNIFWITSSSVAFQVQSETSPPLQMVGRHQRKTQATPGWQIAVSVSKRELTNKLFSGSKTSRSPRLSPNLERLNRGLNRVQSHITSSTGQMVSTSHHYLKARSLEWPSGAGKASGIHISRIGEG